MAANILARIRFHAVNDEHFRAVIRAALRANGFDVRISELAAADRRTTALGLRLRDTALENLPVFAVRADIARLADEDSFLWNRLPSMLAFGHQQALAFRRVIHQGRPGRPGLPAALLMPAVAFSAGISLLDYLADAQGLAEPIFAALDAGTVTSLFGSGREAEMRLREAYEGTADGRLRLLFALVAACGTGIRRLCQRSGDEQGRGDLLQTFAVLHGAQKAVTFHSLSLASGPAGTDAVTAKSVLPFAAMHQIVELFDPPGAAKRRGRELARQLGQAVALTDDLVDLLPDWHSGTPNSLAATARAEERGADGGPAAEWLYQVAGQAGAKIVATLRSASLLYSPWRAAPARLTAVEDAARFATFTIARWVGWPAELSPPSVFAIRRSRPRPFAPCLDALNMLLEQQRGGYREAVHRMTVPRFNAGKVTLETHPALLFQRAVVLDSLLDAYTAGLEVPASVLAREALLLLQEKRSDVRGGWSYLPAVPELPPDVDDLAMVLQALARCGGQPLAAAGHQALDLVLATAERGDALTTWILDPGEAPQRNETFRRYIELTKADGVHPEVVANLLCAVSLQAGETGRRRAANAVAYLESAQHGDGSWHSRWYWGTHYGTYRAVLALTALAPGSPALDRAGAYLVSGQNPDGGWGPAGHSDPLSTAFGALALTALAQPGTVRALGPALEYILSTQQPDGGWPGCPFIAFPRVGGPGVHVYGSSTMTTSFGLKAILAGQRAHSAGRMTRPRTPVPVYRPASAPPTAADWS